MNIKQRLKQSREFLRVENLGKYGDEELDFFLILEKWFPLQGERGLLSEFSKT